jgi:hypothetical protein
MLGRNAKTKEVILAIGIGLALILCNLDHLERVFSQAQHGHGEAPVCFFNSCLTLTSPQDGMVPLMGMGFFLFLFFGLSPLFGLPRPMFFGDPGPPIGFFKKSLLPKYRPKLYKLHSSFLI